MLKRFKFLDHHRHHHYHSFSNTVSQLELQLQWLTCVSKHLSEGCQDSKMLI